jgi:hypothetical protein
MRGSAALVALSPFFWKGMLITICAFILFVGSIYVLLAAIYGLRMGYLVTAVSFFAWMIVFSALWAFGAPGTPRDLGPRGIEPHWQVFAAGTDAIPSKYPVTAQYPSSPWRAPKKADLASVDTVRSVMQKYLAILATQQLEEDGTKVCSPDELPEPGCFVLDPTTFSVQDVFFAKSGSTELAAGHGFFQGGGTELTIYGYFDKGNVPIYSWSFLIVSVIGFAIHLPFLDKAEKRRKEILTGGTAPAWYGPA